MKNAAISSLNFFLSISASDKRLPTLIDGSPHGLISLNFSKLHLILIDIPCKVTPFLTATPIKETLCLSTHNPGPL